MRYPGLLIALAVAVLASPGLTEAELIDVEDPPKGVFSENWYAIMLNEQKSGHMHSKMSRRAHNGRDVIETQMTMTMEAGRGDTTVRVTVEQETTETLEGEPLSFKNTTRLGMMPSITRGTIEDGVVTVKTQQFGQQVQERTYTLPDGAIMSWGAYREQIKRGLEPGTTYEIGLYEPSVAPDKLTPTTVKIGKPETIDLFGRKVEAVKTTQTMKMKSMFGRETEIESVSWLTDAGTAVKLQMEMLNIPVEILACTKPVALAKNDPAELMVDTLIRINKPLPRNAREITYKLYSQSDNGSRRATSVPETDMQRIRRKTDEYVLLAVRRADHAKHASNNKRQVKTLTDEEKKLYLAATSTLNHKDPVIAKLAKEAAGNETDPWKLADKLRRFVSDFVISKNLSVGFATAGEVARSREGDCTEHGVLLAALGRALDIPTRTVTGIVYLPNFNGHRNIFGGHLWTQFWIDGRWVDLDAAMNQTEVDPTHIALGVSAAGDTGIADMVHSIWLNMNNLRVEIEEIEGRR